MNPYHTPCLSPAEGAAVSTTAAPTPSTARLLLATRDDVFREAALAALAGDGYACDVARSGRDARTAVRDTPYDLLICDLDLPESADLSLVRLVSAADDGIPVIVATRHPTVQSAVAAIDLPVVGYLLKPLDPLELLPRVRRALARHQAYRTVRDAEREIASWRDGLSPRATPARGATVSTAIDGFLALTFRNVMESLADIDHARCAISRGSGAPAHACHALNCPRGAQLRDAIRHAIAILEETKGAFRSRTLAELRQQLEVLVAHN